MVCYAVNSVSIHQLPPLSDLLSGAKDADSERPWMAKTLNCSWSRLVNLKKTAMIASHKSDGSAANSASWCQRVHQGANMRCTKGAPSLSCGGPASKKWTFASLVCCCAALHCIAVDLECIFGWPDRPLHYRLWFTQYSVDDCVGLCLIDNLYMIITHVFVHVYCLPRYVRISVLCCVHMCILCIYVHLTALMCPKQLLYRQLVCFSINQLQILP